MIRAGAWRFRYNALDQLTAASLGGVPEKYRYDAFGRQVAKTVGTTTTRYLWDEAQSVPRVATETGGGHVRHYDYLGGRLIGLIAGGASYGYLTDRRGSIS